MSPKKKHKEDKWKNPPEDVAVNLPPDANPISKGTIPPQEGQEEEIILQMKHTRKGMWRGSNPKEQLLSHNARIEWPLLE
jgi:hypothetical protein